MKLYGQYIQEGRGSGTASRFPAAQDKVESATPKRFRVEYTWPGSGHLIFHGVWRESRAEALQELAEIQAAGSATSWIQEE